MAHICTERGRISEFLLHSLMSKDNNVMTGKILNLTLEIIFLLTGEDFILSKKQKDSSADACKLCVSEGSAKERPCQEETPEPGETTSSEAQEVLVRCEDVAIFFSPEEWEYMEGHKERYKELITESHQPLTTADGDVPTSPPRSCTSPLASQKCMEEDHKVVTQEPQVPPAVGTVLPQCKEEEIPVEVGSGNHFSVTPKETRGRNVTSHTGVKKDNKRKPRDSQVVAGDKPLPSRCKEEPNEISLGPPTSWKVQPDSPHVLVPVQHKNGDNPNNLEGSISSDIHPIAVIVKPQSVLSLTPPQKAKSDQQPHSFCQEPGGDTPSSSIIKFEDSDGNELAVVHICKQCGQAFGNKIDLIAHEQMLHCALCQKCFKDKSALVVHQWAFHMPKPNTKETKCATKEEGPFSCNKCGKSLLSKSALDRHQSIHTGAFSCPECGKCLTDRSGLIRHRRTHTAERSFPCSDCGRRFTRRNHLMFHQSVHKESISPTAENVFR